MNMRIKLFDSTLPLPAYQTSGAAAFDLYARERTEIPAGEVRLVPLNIAIELPAGHWALLAARSSLHKKGLMLANGIGVGDEDYRGDEDEYRAALYNRTAESVVVERGERIVQLLVLPTVRVSLEKVDHLGNSSRGGFGSTGKL